MNIACGWMGNVRNRHVLSQWHSFSRAQGDCVKSSLLAETTTLNPESNSRINIGNMTTYIFLRSQNQWVKFQDTNQINGMSYE